MNKQKKLIIFGIILFVFFIFISLIFSIVNMSNNNILSGISINNIDVSGKSKEDVNSILSELIKNKSGSHIKFIYEDYIYEIELSSINIHYNTDKALNEAYNIGRAGNIIQNNYSILKTLFFKKNLDIEVSFDEDSFDKIISNISSELPNKHTEPSYYIEDSNLIITNGVSGIAVNKEELKKSLQLFINDFSSSSKEITIPVKSEIANTIDIDKIHSEVYKEVKNAYYEKEPFKVYAEVVGIDFDVESAKNFINEHPDNLEYTISLNYTKPEITVQNLNIDVFPDLLATFSTRYDASNTSRSTNLKLAANKINGTILAPDSEFSYNKVVGKRSIAEGYKEAKIYSNGQVVDGIGGGICQISSTLYDAAIFANLKITERHNHQFIVSYVSAGRDATVSYGAKDLKFINNRTFPIKILVTVESGIAKVDIYGIKEETEYDISFEIETLSDIRYNTLYEKDYSLGENEEIVKQAGSYGAVVNSYKVIKKSGVVISKELLSKDTYKAMNRIIANKTGKEN